MGAESAGSPRLIPVASLREFFHESLQGTFAKQHLSVDGHTEHYIVNLLTLFARSEALYEQTPEGPRLKPLALMLAEALDAASARDRERHLQRLGDVSLFVAGFFAQGFARKLVDIDYHIAMGGNAYSSLADTMQRTAAGRCVAGIYAQLAQKFQGLVDALNEVSEMSHQHSDADILRLYEIWIKTGSPRAHALLRQLGVQPVAVAGARREH